MNTTLNFQSILQLHQAGQLQEALVAYQQFLQREPTHVDALVSLASLYLQSGRLQESGQTFERALKLQPRKLLALHNYGLCLKQQKHYDQALAHFDLALEVDPHYELAYKNKLALLASLGRQTERFQALQQAVQQLPQSRDLNLLLVSSLREQLQSAAALAHIDRLLTLQPKLVSAHNTRGNILLELRREDEAVHAYQTAIDLQPAYANAHGNLAIAYLALAQYQAALDSFDRALALDPELKGMRNNRANALQNLYRFEEALQAYDAILARHPGDSVAAANKGMLFLLLGRFKEGWPLYEARWKNAAVSVHPELMAYPQWNGIDTLQGKILILHPEQGFGDTIQFSRYARILAAQAELVYLVVNQSLFELMQYSISQWPDCANLRVISAGAEVPKFHYQLPLLSAPRVLKTDLHSIPDFATYLFADPDTIERWQHRLGRRPRFRIGLVWSGSSQHTNDKNRSLSLSELIEILRSQLSKEQYGEIAFHALQKEINAEDLSILLRSSIQHHSQDLHSFKDTAALISQMDLVISVDTSVAHLAAAMGKPTWILLSHIPDFRWLLEREDTPWYHSVRLFRQQQARNWQAPLHQVAQACAQMYQVSRTISSSVSTPNLVVTGSTGSRMNEANSLVQQGHWIEAENMFREEFAQYGGSAKLHNNWGVVLQKLRRFDQALAAFAQAIQLDPEYVSPRLNKSICLLSLGQFAEGWQLYEWRWKNEQWDSSRRHFTQPLWLGGTDIAGKRILIYAEQGLGDTLQFCRLLAQLQARGAVVLFEVQASLLPLLRCLPVQLYGIGTAPQDYDFQCPLMSLPLALGLTLSAIPQQVPYLHVTADKQAQWRQKISRGAGDVSPSSRLKIGVVWAGSAHHRNDAQRSIPMAIFSRLLQEDADYFVLQKEVSRTDRFSVEMMQRFGKRIVMLDVDLSDFGDTAAAIDCLDLVISVDTSVAHLAGAMAKRLLLLLPWEADFRWLHERQDSPWYPTAELFRQTQVGDWNAPIANLRVRLQQVIQEALTDQRRSTR